MTMSTIIEIILWALIAAGVVLGAKNGFIHMAAKPVKLVLALILAFSFSAAVAEELIIPMIEQPITNYIYDLLVKNCPDLNIETIANDLPLILKLAAAMYGINIEEIVAENAGRDIIAEITATLAEPVINIVSVVVSFVVIFVVSTILIAIVIKVLDLIFSEGIFGVINKILGGAAGVVLSLAIAWAVAFLAELIFHIKADGKETLGILYDFFNTYNPIDLLLSIQ